MRIKSYIGKTVSLERMNDYEANFHPPGVYADDFSMAEIYLNDFQIQTYTDRCGRNAYSVQLFLDANKIIKIVRIGHCHMCGGQGSDDELTRFPHQTLETQADYILNSILA